MTQDVPLMNSSTQLQYYRLRNGKCFFSDFNFASLTRRAKIFICIFMATFSNCHWAYKVKTKASGTSRKLDQVFLIQSTAKEFVQQNCGHSAAFYFPRVSALNRAFRFSVFLSCRAIWWKVEFWKFFTPL